MRHRLSVHLPERLGAIAAMIPQGARVADIGSDHALLPIHLIQIGKVEFAVASDIAEGPYQAACRSIRIHGASDRISVRMGSGLETLMPYEVDTVVIAGMGGATARDILQASPAVVKTLDRIILQPMNAPATVRAFLYQQGFCLVSEEVVEDQGRLYDILTVQPCAMRSGVSELDAAYDPYKENAEALMCAFEFGPLNLSHPTPPSLKSMHLVTQRWEHIVKQMKRSENHLETQKLHSFLSKLAWVRDWCRKNSVNGDGEGWDTRGGQFRG